MTGARAWTRAAITLAAVVALDQATKAAAVAAIDRGESITIAPGLDLTNVRNTGIAFGALSGGGAPVVVLTAAALALLTGYLALRHATRLAWLPAGMLLGGALGNLADRAREGTVIDFLDPIAWPAFNVADAAIVGGVVGLVYVESRRPRPGR